MSGPPDPSLPDQHRQQIRVEIEQYLSDPLGFPPSLVNWLSTLISLNALPNTPNPNASVATSATGI